MAISLFIITLTSCSTSKNITSARSYEKLGIVQQINVHVQKKGIADNKESWAAPNADTFPPFRAGGVMAAKFATPARKLKTFASTNLSFHRVRNASLNAKLLMPTLSDEQGNETKTIKKNGGYSITALAFTNVGIICFFIPLSVLLYLA